MKIKFLGTRGNIEPSAPYHSKHSGVLIDNKILFDLGEESFLEEGAKYIFITHLHPDHAFFVNAKEKIEIDIPIYAPEKAKNVTMKVLDSPIEINDYSIQPIPTIHSKLVESQAYILEKNNKRILYTGDIVWILKEYHKQLQNLDLVITDGSFMRKGGMIRRDDEGNIYGHKGIPGLVNLFEDYTNHIIFTHFGSWFYKDMDDARKKMKALSDKLTIEAAYDGLVLEI